jgi:hypothetical protein
MRNKQSTHLDVAQIQFLLEEQHRQVIQFLLEVQHRQVGHLPPVVERQQLLVVSVSVCDLVGMELRKRTSHMYRITYDGELGFGSYSYSYF